MSQKYHASAVLGKQITRLITNDLYLAAFLLCQGCEWCGLVRNERRRMSFVFSGENVHHLREEYESGIVRLNVRAYRDTLLTVRRKMDAEQRSVAYVPDTGAGVRTAQA
jgi:hypothetical protein